jgi:hypothetical protein
MRTSGLQPAAALPTPSLDQLTPVIQDLLERAHSTRGVLLRDAPQEALLLFPTLVLGPQRHGASSSSVKSEITARFDLWRRGLIPELTARAKAQAQLRPQGNRRKSARAARRAARLIRKNQFSRAANLAGSLGIADATLDTLHSLPSLFPEPTTISEEDLKDFYGPTAAPQPDSQPVRITVEILRNCLAGAPPLSSHHGDGWRTEHLSQLAPDDAFCEALAALATSIIRGDVSDKISHLLSSATLVILLKKDAKTMVAMKRAQGHVNMRPQSPLEMGSTFVKLASNCALHLIRGAMGPVVGPAQFSVETKGG